jgi:CubicO group peptidase (beta-lactamase class C family)
MSSTDPVASVDDKNDSEPSTSGLMDGDFDKLVEKLLEAHHVPGMSIAIVHNGKIQCKV